MSLEDGDLDMQPLSKVRFGANVSLGVDDVMASRPKVTIKVAECIAKWAEIESSLGLFLALLLNADQKAILGMYEAIESSSGRLRMVIGASKAKLSSDHFRVAEVIFTNFISPAARERNKFAHWCWGQSPELPEDLLLMAPEEKLALHVETLTPPRPTKFNRDNIFVISEKYATTVLRRLSLAHDFLLRLTSTIWNHNPQEERAQYLESLSNEPRIRSILDRPQNQGKSPKSQPSSPSPDQSGEA